MCIRDRPALHLPPAPHRPAQRRHRLRHRTAAVPDRLVGGSRRWLLHAGSGRNGQTTADRGAARAAVQCQRRQRHGGTRTTSGRRRASAVGRRKADADARLRNAGGDGAGRRPGCRTRGRAGARRGARADSGPDTGTGVSVLRDAQRRPGHGDGARRRGRRWCADLGGGCACLLYTSRCV